MTLDIIIIALIVLSMVVGYIKKFPWSFRWFIELIGVFLFLFFGLLLFRTFLQTSNIPYFEFILALGITITSFIVMRYIGKPIEKLLNIFNLGIFSNFLGFLFSIIDMFLLISLIILLASYLPQTHKILSSSPIVKTILQNLTKFFKIPM